VNADNPRFYVETSPVCVGILPELFRKRTGVVRTLHPTHSVAVLGRDATDFAEGDERIDTPCNRDSAWGKLLDRKAKILLIGVDLRKQTFFHGIEEWSGVPGRLTDGHEQLYTVLRDGTEIFVPSRRHVGSPSENYGKVQALLEREGAIEKGEFGDAVVLVCDTEKMYDVLWPMLRENPDLFSDSKPLDHIVP
jgi:aminoglycoside 3-N-acetyltransferase